MKRIVLLGAIVASASAVVVHAQPVKLEDQVKQRRSAFAVLGHNFANLGAMAQEKKPYNKDEAVRSAEIVAVLAPYPHGFFGEGTDKGGGETKARPEIWQKRADFDGKMDKMVGETKKLPQAARTDLAALKTAVGDAGNACKACHDDYRAK